MRWKNPVDYWGGGYEEAGTAFKIVYGRGKAILLTPSSSTDATLPDATTLGSWVEGGPVWSITNAHASNDISIKDFGGNVIATLTASPTGSEYDSVNVYLESRATQNGVWHFAKASAGQAAAPPVDEKYYILGGKTPIAADGDLAQEYDVELDTWADKTAASALLTGCAAGVSSDKGYIARGNLTADRETRSYDAGFDVWVDLLDMTIGAQVSISGDVYSGKLYAMGVAESGVNDGTEEYTVSSNTWAVKADATVRQEQANTKAYPAASQLIVYSSSVSFTKDTMQDYTPGTDAWGSRNDMTFPGRSNPGLAMNASQDKAWLFCGDGDVEVGVVRIDDTDMYDPALDSWSEQTDFPGGIRSDKVAALAANRMFVSCGESVQDEHYEYQYSIDTWVAKTDANRIITESISHGQGINAG